MLDLSEAGLVDAVARIAVATGDDERVRIVLGASSSEAAARLLASTLPERVGRALAVTTRLDGPGFEATAVALHGDLRLPFTVGADRFEASLTSWSPQTPASLGCVRSVVERLLACEPASRVLELGCGVGTLSVHLARASASLVGVDLVRGAVDDAARNAATLGVENATFRQGRADQAVRRLLARGDHFDRLVLHGMRRPFGLDLMNVLPALRVSRVVYLAPSAISMVRDLEVLRGYRLAHMEQIAQLPGTAHTLTAGLLLP
jgi:SAM-dependent methyltransferase